jgi:hypothetical protein
LARAALEHKRVGAMRRRRRKLFIFGDVDVVPKEPRLGPQDFKEIIPF